MMTCCTLDPVSKDEALLNCPNQDQRMTVPSPLPALVHQETEYSKASSTSQTVISQLDITTKQCHQTFWSD